MRQAEGGDSKKQRRQDVFKYGRGLCRHYWRHESVQRLRCRFGTEDALEAGADELHPDQPVAASLRRADVHHAAQRFEIILAAARVRSLQGNTNLQVRTDGYVEAGAKRGTATAQVFAGRFFLEGEATGVPAPNMQGQAHRDSTFRSLSGNSLGCRAHGLVSPKRPLFARRSALRYRPLPPACAPYVRFCAVRCHFQPHG
jgi:hypothetical protein